MTNNKPIKILLVEDDEDDYLITRDLLAEIGPDYATLEWHSTYSEGLAAILKGDFDICLVDKNLGADNGIELICEAIQKGNDKPLVLLTGLNDRETDTEAMEAGATDYMVKSQISPSLLERVIRYAIYHANAERAQKTSLQELEKAVDARTKELLDEMQSRRDAERQAQERQTELAHLWRQNAMGDVSTILSHELNQPLALITGYAQECIKALRDDKVSRAAILEDVKHVAKSANRAGDIIRKVRRFVSKEEPKMVEVNLNSEIVEIKEMLKYEANKHNVELKVEVAQDVRLVHADPVQIQQVIMNFIDNGIQAVTQDVFGGGQVTISVINRGDEEVEVAVSDTAGLLRDEEIAEVFNPFFTTKNSGLGLGLSICQSIIEVHHGRLWADIDTSGNTVFHFVLPMINSENCS